MGKSEIQSMPIHRPESNLICVPSTCKELYITNLSNGVEEDPEEIEADQVVLPNQVEMLPSQVAGHMNDGKSAGERIIAVLLAFTHAVIYELLSYVTLDICFAKEERLVPFRSVYYSHHNSA